MMGRSEYRITRDRIGLVDYLEDKAWNIDQNLSNNRKNVGKVLYFFSIEFSHVNHMPYPRKWILLDYTTFSKMNAGLIRRKFRRV